MPPSGASVARVLTVGLLVLSAEAWGSPPLAAPQPGEEVWASVLSAPQADTEALCAVLLHALPPLPTLKSPGDCSRVGTPSGDFALQAARGSGRFALHVSLEQLADGSLLLRLEQWAGSAGETGNQLVWTIPPGARHEQEPRASALLAQALGRRVGLAPALDTRGMFPGEASLGPDYGYLALELGALLAAGTVWYNLDTAVNGPDWVYDYSWDTVRRKLFTLEPYAFDENSLHLNSPGHPAAGMLYYLSARGHRLGMLGAFLASSAATAGWEYIPEFREIVSLNDLLLTPIGGIALGEPLYQLSLFFERSANTPANRLLSMLLAGPGSITPLRSRRPPTTRLLDENGFSRVGWHRLRLTVGAAAEKLEGQVLPRLASWTEFSAEQVMRESYGRPGMDHGILLGPVATRLQAGFGVGVAGLLEGSLHSEVVYAAYVFRAVGGTSGLAPREPQGQLSGSEGHLGLSATYGHEERRLKVSVDRLGQGGPLGLDGHLAVYRAGWTLRATGSLHPVFAAVDNLAWPVGGPQRPGLPAVLAEQGYHWAYGLRAAARMEVRVGDAELGLAVRGITLAGLAGRLSDGRSSYALWAGHAIPNGLRGRLWLEATGRSSRAWDFQADLLDTRLRAEVGWEF